MRGRSVLAVLVGMVLLSAGGAWAQDAPAPRLGRFRVGPFFVTPAIALRQLGVDTNVFNSATDPQSDFTFTAGADVRVVSRGRRVRVSFLGRGDYVYFHEIESERSVSGEASGSLEVPLRRFTPYARGRYLITRERPSVEIDARSRRREDAVEAGLRVRLVRKLEVDAGGRQGRVRFDADEVFAGSNLSRVLDRDSTAAIGALRWMLTPLTTIVVGGEVEEDRFLKAPERDADSYRILPGVEFEPRALLSGSARVGYREFRPRDARLEGFSGLVASAALAYRLYDSTRFQLSLDRDIGFSYEPLEPNYLLNGVGGAVERRLGGRFDITAGAHYYRYDYREGFEAGTSPETRREVVRTYSASIGYRAAQGVRLGVGVSYWERESNRISGRGYEGIRFGTSVTYGS